MSADSLTAGYERPSAALARAVEASARQSFLLSPQKESWLLASYRTLLTLSDLAAPEVRLAGLRFNPGLRASNRDLYYHGLELGGAHAKMVVGLPPEARIRHLSWSPDGRFIAFSEGSSGKLLLWLLNVEAGTAAPHCELPLNAVTGSPPLRWLRDSSGLVMAVVPPEAEPPLVPTTPSGPKVEEHGGGRSPSRTFQDLLGSAADADRFEFFLRSEVWRVPLQGEPRRVLEARGVQSFAPSPCGAFLLLQELRRPYSYQVPYHRFPQRAAVFDWSGAEQLLVADLPLTETVSPDFDSVRPGRRYVGWREDCDACVFWLEAADGGDALAAAEVRDTVWQQRITGEPQQLLALPGRVEQLCWGRGDLAVVQDGWWKTRERRVWRARPDETGGEELLFAFSSEDQYADPGRPLLSYDAQGRHRLAYIDEQNSLFLVGSGASPEGERPFLDRFGLESKTATRLFHSQPPCYEYPLAVLSPEGTSFLLQRETPTAPPNLVRRTPAGEQTLTALQPPVPEVSSLPKELIRYRRADGVELTGTLYLPAEFRPGHDAPLPTIMWAYPSEFKSAARAGQLRDSPYRYVHPAWSGPLFLALCGYAVLDDPGFPIVGEGDAEPNDTYVTQLLASAQAAVDTLVERGVGDPARMAIGGHSYGAFTTANLLVHSRLFRAGIGRSGAYNRTLTPFGFQSEERTYWQARDTYHAMSPFTHADTVSAPMLLIHGAVDSNPGTHPMQSERFYAALKGLGATARLCMLPLEDHGYRARESALHTLWEMERWLDLHVKRA